MAHSLATSDEFGAPVHFCESLSPWQRDSNASTNRLLRDYFPKGVNEFLRALISWARSVPGKSVAEHMTLDREHASGHF